MAHLHGDRAFGTGSGSSNQNLIGAGLDRDSGDSSGSGDARLSGTSRISAGSDLETFDENPELETRMQESGRNLASLGGGLENAPPVVLPGPVTSPLQFDGIVSAASRSLDFAHLTQRCASPSSARPPPPPFEGARAEAPLPPQAPIAYRSLLSCAARVRWTGAQQGLLGRCGEEARAAEGPAHI